MKRILLASLAAFSCFAVAAPAVPQLPPIPLPPAVPPAPAPATELQTYGTGIPLAEFLRITLGSMAHRAYVLAPDAAQAQAPIAVDFTRSKISDPLPLVREVLNGLGLSMREVSGVLLIERRRPEEQKRADLDVFVYQPRHREVGSLATYFNLFPDIAFSYSGGLSVRSLSAAPGTGSNAAAGKGGLQPTTTTGATTFSAENKDPALLVARGTPAELKRLQAFLAEVDTPIPEVLVRAYVFEVRDTDSRDSAVQLVMNVLGNRLGIQLGGPSPTGASPGDALRLNLPNFSMAISALTGDSRVRLVSSPTLRAVDGSTASATVGSDTPTLGSIVTNNGSTQQSVAYQSAGVLLNVSPRILRDSIRLNVSQELSSFVQTETGLRDTPTKLRRDFKSDVVVHDGEAVLLGGLSEAQSSDAHREGVLGFGSNARSHSSSELVVLLKVERL